MQGVEAGDLPRPQNFLIQIINKVLDLLLSGEAAPAVIASAQLAFPLLKLPVVSWIFEAYVTSQASAVNAGLKGNIGKIVIRYQGDLANEAWEKHIPDLQKGGQSEEDLDKIKRDLDKVIQWGD